MNNRHGHTRNSTAWTAALILTVSLLPGCAERESAVVVRKSEGNATLDRTLDPALPTAAWSRGGSGKDSLLSFPLVLTSDDRLVYVVDAGAKRVVAVNAGTGRTEWASSSREGEPGSLVEPVAISVIPGGGVAVFDRERRAVQFFDQSGHPHSVIQLLQLTPVQSICVLADSSLLVAGAPGPAPIVRVDRAGRVVAWIALPWNDLANAPRISVQAWLASDRHGACALAMAFGRGFALYGGAGFGAPSDYVEWFDVPAAEVTQTKSTGLITTREHLKQTRVAARDAILLRDEVWIPFQGTSEHAGRLIDRYDRATGRYLRSTVVQERIISATANDTRFFITTTENGYPKLVAYNISTP